MNNHSLKSLLLVGGLALAAGAPVFGSEAEDMFKRMDINGDKKVTSTEHAQFAETMFRQSDVDRDSKVSAAECEAAQANYDKKAKVNKEATAMHMRLVDTDNDGQISQGENATFARNEFLKADKNSDGVLNEDEVEDAYKVMKKEMKN